MPPMPAWCSMRKRSAMRVFRCMRARPTMPDPGSESKRRAAIAGPSAQSPLLRAELVARRLKLGAELLDLLLVPRILRDQHLDVPLVAPELVLQAPALEELRDADVPPQRRG